MAGPMSRRLLTLTAVLLTLSATAFAQATAPAPPTRADQDAPQPFRVSVDVVAVDVQVIDREGNAVPDLGPEKFNVTINGRRRRVVSAERIGDRHRPRCDARAARRRSSARPRHHARGRLRQLQCRRDPGRDSGDAPVREAAVAGRLRRPVGVSERPEGAIRRKDHASVLDRARQQVVGQRDLAEITQFNVRPSELVDMTRELLSRRRTEGRRHRRRASAATRPIPSASTG